MSYRLALDIGTNSIGWCALDLDQKGRPCGVSGMGVRIFPDGRKATNQEPLAADRRLKRQMRRMRDRYLRRRGQLMNALVRHGLMPAAEAERKALEVLDPYALRARGLDAPLTLHELGRALFHLNQRRGFRSNRKVDKDEESGKIKPAIQKLRNLMAESETRTLGEFLDQRHRQYQAVRSRLHGKGKQAGYDFYPERSLVEEEFDALWTAQAKYHPDQTDAAREEIRKIIFYQRPLKPVRPGLCTLEPEEDRAPQALPVAQRFRIYQELNHLRAASPDLEERPLTLAERDTLARHLLQGKDLTFDALRRKLKLPEGWTFSLEAENRDKLKGDLAAKVLGSKDHFGPRWHTLSQEDQERLVDLLLVTEDEALLLGLLTTEWGLTAAQAAKVAVAPLPKGYSRLSCKALHAVTRELAAEVVPYAEAVVRAGYASHSQFDTGEIHDRLPYYALVLQRHVMTDPDHHGNPTKPAALRFGRITNPTVHIALNQLRKVVNALIKAQGLPAQVVLEVARDLKNGPQARREIKDRQAKNKQANDDRRKLLEEMGIAVTADALLRLRLWEELAKDPVARRCPYTGEQISIRRLFSAEVEVEHILPFARTLDNSPANMTVSLRRANRYKENRTPFEAFGQSRDGYDWPGIVERAGEMPPNKRKRFAPEALERFQEQGDFLDRQLVDTQYISRVAREYLSCLYAPRKTAPVWATPGRLTSLLAARWLAHGPDEPPVPGQYRHLTLTREGFMRKQRIDHRHHAVDAALIGVTDRGLLKQVADLRAREVDQGVERFLAGLAEPWERFRDQVLEAAGQIVVSHRPDHGIGGQLHDENPFGILGKNDTPGNAQKYAPVSKLVKPADLLKVKGFGLRAELLRAATGRGLGECRQIVARLQGMREKDAKEGINSLVGMADKDFTERVAAFAASRGMRRVRLRDKVALVAIMDKTGRAYKGVKTCGNAYYEIRLKPDGIWDGDIVSRLDACRPGFRTRWFRTRCAELGYPLVTRLFSNDMLEIIDNGERKIVYVVKLSEKQIALAEHREADVDRRTRDPRNPFSLIYKGSPAALQKSGARPLYVDPIGRVRYLEAPCHASPGGGDSW